MDRTNQEIWDETLRTADLLHQMEQSLEPMEKAIAGIIPVDKSCLPVHYVSDAQILTRLLLSLKDRGVKIS